MTQQNWFKNQHFKGGMGKVGVWDEEIQAIMCKVDKQQGYWTEQGKMVLKNLSTEQQWKNRHRE